MYNVFLRFPEGKAKAVTFSYDDGSPFDKRLADMSEDSTLIKKTVIPLVRDDRFILHCVIVLIEDIAEVSEFEVILGE